MMQTFINQKMIQLIQAATQSQSNQHRKEAERQIIESRQANSEQFFQQVIDAFKNKQNHISIREASGTLIMVSILAKNKSGSYYWDAISGNMKNHVKNVNLELLIDGERNVRRAAANIVSAICFIQLPRNQWEGIVDKICLNVSHENEIVKQASILTLGFICSRMKQKHDFEFTSQTQDNILSGIILGLQQSQPLIIQTALKALRDSISSLRITLRNEQYRSFVLKQLVDIINSEKYGVEGLQILGEFVKTCYQFLGAYIQGLVQLLEPIIANTKNEDVCIAAMQVWENIAAQYKDLSQTNQKIVNFITGEFGLKIVTALLKNLSVMEQGDQIDDNPISDSASRALQTIFENGSTQYKKLVIEFVQASIAQNDWKHRQASIKGFSLLLHGLSDEQNQELISNSINELMGLLNDKSKQVQYATMESLIIITQVCSKFILTSQLFVEYLKLILSKVSISQKFLKSGCKIIDNLCQSEKQYKLGKFNTISDDLIGLFLKYALASQSSNACTNWTTITIMNIIEVTHNDAVLVKYLNFILQNFDNINQVKDAERRQSISSAFFTFMQFCLHGLKKTGLDQTIIGLIYTKVTNNFKANSDVNADGLFVIQALVPFFNGNAALVNDFWGYIVHALQKWQDHMVFKATICCIASFLTVYGQSLTEKLPTFVPTVIELLQSPNFPKQDKIDCLVLMGEVFLSCGKAAQVYLQKFLSVIMLCCAAALQLTETDFNYSEELKDNIVQALMCVVHGLNEANQFMSVHVPQLFQFAALSCNKKSRPTVAYVKRCVLLLSDFAKLYPNVVKPLKQQQFIMECISTLSTYNKNNENTPAIKYAKQNFK